MITTDISVLNPSLQVAKQMSSRYQVMDTRILVQEILALGKFEIASIATRSGKKANGRGTHVVKLRTIDPIILGSDQVKPEIVIMNSYDGSSLLKVYVGVYRIICSNGLIIATKEFGEVGVRHMGTPAEVAFQVAMGFLDNLKLAVDAQKQMKTVYLTKDQISEFTNVAIALRWDNLPPTESNVESIVKVVRPEDEGDSLWVVYNRVQEHLTLGGMKLNGMKRKARPIKNAVVDTEFNKNLFQLAMSYVPVDAEIIN